MRPRLSYANVMSTLCFFLLLGGGAYAANQLPKNSVGSPQIKKNAVKTGDIARNAVKVGKLAKEAVKAGKLAKNAVPTNRIRNNAVTGAKVNEASLSTVPAANLANTANTADSANSLAPAEDWHEVGAPGEPGFQNSWTNAASPIYNTAAFYKDHESVVHLKGVVTGGAGAIFQLPPGYRPIADTEYIVPISCSGGTCSPNNLGVGIVFGANSEVPNLSGTVIGEGAMNVLDGISFRAES